MILFLVLLLCAAAGVYCAIHFGSARAVERAFITLRERPDDPQPRYLGVLIPPTPNHVATKAEQKGTDRRASTPPPATTPSADAPAKTGQSRPIPHPAAIERWSFGLPNETGNSVPAITSETLPARRLFSP